MGVPFNDNDDDQAWLLEDSQPVVEKPLRESVPYSVKGCCFFIATQNKARKGVFKITGEVDEDTAAQLMDAVYFFDRFENLNLIEVLINSPGGEVAAGISIAMLLREQEEVFKRTIRIKVYGEACSAASVILTAGTVGERLLARHALVMVHELWQFTMDGESVKDAKKKALMMELMQKNLNEFMVGRIKIDAAKLQHLVEEETWLRADKAIEYGFADSYLSPGTSS